MEQLEAEGAQRIRAARACLSAYDSDGSKDQPHDRPFRRRRGGERGQRGPGDAPSSVGRHGSRASNAATILRPRPARRHRRRAPAAARRPFGGMVGERAAEVIPVAPHGERRGGIEPPKSKANTGAGIAAELECHQRQQHPLAGAGRPTISVWPTSPTCSRIGTASTPVRAKNSGGPPNAYPVLARPDRRERHHLGEVQRRDRRLADIGETWPGNDPSHASMAFTVSRMQVKSRP